MDRKEAIERIQQDLEVSKKYLSKEYKEALQTAIEALSANYTTEKPNDIVEQENDVVVEPTDLISKSAVMETIGYWTTTEEWGHCFIPSKLVDMINELPSASVPTKCIAQINIDADEIVKRIKDEYEIADRPTELLQDGTLKVNVNNGAEVNRVLVWGDDGSGGLYYADDRPSGEWMIVNKGLDIYICDQCGEVEQIQRIPIWDYCPNCGAYMGGTNENPERR